MTARLTPMPSPNGTNFARLFLPVGWPNHGMAMDERPRRLASDAARAPLNTDEELFDRVLQFCASKGFDEAELRALAKMLLGEQAADDVTTPRAEQKIEKAVDTMPRALRAKVSAALSVRQAARMKRFAEDWPSVARLHADGRPLAGNRGDNMMAWDEGARSDDFAECMPNVARLLT